MSRNREQIRSAAPRLSPRRIALALAMAAAGMFAVADSFANATAPSSPALAHRVAPWNGRIAGEFAQRTFDARPSPDVRSQSAILARGALASEPTAVEALSVLALQALMRSDGKASNALFAHELKLSRRELPPRLWAIEAAAMRGDVDGALESYDIALRTSKSANGRLFPILASAIIEPRIRARLITILAAEPVWRDDFISHATRAGNEPGATAQLLAEAARAGIPIDTDLRTALVDRFADKGRSDEAWAYYRTIRPGAQAGRSRDPRFTFGGTRRSIFDWNTSEYASFQSSATGGAVDISVPTATGASILSQAIVLPAGRYTLSGSSEGIDQPERSRLYWLLKCDEREVGRVELPNSAANGGRFAGIVAVPGGCPMHVLTLMARPSDDFGGVTGRITRVSLEPAR